MHRNRVCEIILFLLTRSQLQRLASAMQEQFPVLIHLRLSSGHYNGPPLALPNGFLGGCALRPRSLESHSVAFPVLPKLLLYATHLVRLELGKVSRSGYISPEAIVTGLAVLANLESLTIRFEFFPSLPNQESQSPLLMRTVLPSLTSFEFQGRCSFARLNL